MSLRFAMVADTHVGLPPSGLAERLSLVYAAIARLAPDFVLHCGDITDTGLPGEYDRYQAAVPAALRGRIRHVPGNHEVRWDPTAKELYRARFGAVPYSFDAGGVHFTAFDLTQPLLEPGHCGMAGLDWLARDLGDLALGTPALLFQHFPVGDGHDFVDDQTALLELMARHDVRGLFAGHVHRETVTRLDGLIQVTLRAVRDEAVFYRADLADGPALAVSRVTVAGDGARASVPVATGAAVRPASAPGRRHAAAPAPGRRRAPAPAVAAPAERVGAGRDRRGRLRRGGRVDRRGHRRVPAPDPVRGPAASPGCGGPRLGPVYRRPGRRPRRPHAVRPVRRPASVRPGRRHRADPVAVRRGCPGAQRAAGGDGRTGRLRGLHRRGPAARRRGGHRPARLVRARPRVLGRAGRVRRRAGLHGRRRRVRPRARPAHRAGSLVVPDGLG